MFTLISRPVQAVVLSTAIATFGCAPPAPAPQAPQVGNDQHDHAGHNHAETYPAAVTELKELRDTIRDAFAAKKPGDAHDSLHEVFHVLETIPGLAQKAGIDEAGIATIKEQVNKLIGFFDKIDHAMHIGQEPNYDKGSEIDAAVDVLAGLSK